MLGSIAASSYPFDMLFSPLLLSQNDLSSAKMSTEFQFLLKIACLSGKTASLKLLRFYKAPSSSDKSDESGLMIRLS